MAPIHNQSPENISADAPVPARPIPLQWCHHLGLLIFSLVLEKIAGCSGKNGVHLRQFLGQILLGAVNIEQSKRLNSAHLRLLFGRAYKDLLKQRQALSDAASPETILGCLRINAEMINLTAQRDFYLDPHTKHYTGEKNVLKGWVASTGRAGKAIHSDYIHTSAGFPAYFVTTDNYLDLRERVFTFLERFRTDMQFNQSDILAFVIDRGIFGLETFQEFTGKGNLHLITWEKDYKPGDWEEARGADGEFRLLRTRNHSTDFRTYQFSYQDHRWKKDERVRRLIVRATNPKGRLVEAAILSDDCGRCAREVIELMFSRWLQENDFKYLGKHFGIDEITSYKAIPYEEMRDTLEEKQITSAHYKALQKAKQTYNKKLKDLLFKREKTSRKQKERREQIEQIEQLQQQQEVDKKPDAQYDKKMESKTSALQGPAKAGR